eukprot:3760576-Prorocentrum_lima.AAC.1
MERGGAFGEHRELVPQWIMQTATWRTFLAEEVDNCFSWDLSWADGWQVLRECCAVATRKAKRELAL